MNSGLDEIREALRARGLRTTPQRRAILGSFRGGRAEHLSADEIYSHATQTIPDLGRGTVYATLAEFTEVGLLAALGTPEPVRYETNVTPHAHFRCRLCLRLFDVDGPAQDPQQNLPPGFVGERVETRIEGVCADCGTYQKGLLEGTRSIARGHPSLDALGRRGSASGEVASPLGPLLIAATPEGLVRVGFEEHGDASALRAHASSRRGSRGARDHLDDTSRQLEQYFAGATAPLGVAVDWQSLGPADQAGLRATQGVRYAAQCSYLELGTDLPARELGRIMGANPIAIVAPCHRVTRGTEMPRAFVGGTARRAWLNAHERDHDGALAR